MSDECNPPATRVRYAPRGPDAFPGLITHHSSLITRMIRYEFPGKVVLVTGSSRGIGAGVLSAFAKAGATCVLHFWDDPGGGNRRDADALAAQLRALPGKPAVHVLAADVR